MKLMLLHVVPCYTEDVLCLFVIRALSEFTPRTRIDYDICKSKHASTVALKKLILFFYIRSIFDEKRYMNVNIFPNQLLKVWSTLILNRFLIQSWTIAKWFTSIRHRTMCAKNVALISHLCTNCVMIRSCNKHSMFATIFYGLKLVCICYRYA